MMNNAVILCDEIINFADSAWTNVKNTMSTNVMSTWINSADKKVKCKLDCCIYVISLVIISLLLLYVISIGSYYHYTRLWIKKSALFY